MSMTTSRVPQIRNLEHTTLEDLDLSAAEAEEFAQRTAVVVAEILNDPIPPDDAFKR